jgi:hypothetical protein
MPSGDRESGNDAGEGLLMPDHVYHPSFRISGFLIRAKSAPGIRPHAQAKTADIE